MDTRDLTVRYRPLAFGIWIIAMQVAGTGCTGASVADLDQQSEVAVAERMLYSLELGPDHTLEFWEYPGTVLISQESSPAGVESISSRLPLDGLSFENTYRLALPSAREVPAVLLDADARRVERARFEADLPTVESAELGDDTGESHAALPTAALSAGAACSPDYFNDNYGSNWFRDKYCPSNVNAICRMNFTSYAIDPRSSGFKWTVMAADFVASAGASASYQFWNCVPRANVPAGQCFVDTRSLASNATVDPRTVKAWNVSGGISHKASAAGRDPCKKIHVAATW